MTVLLLLEIMLFITFGDFNTGNDSLPMYPLPIIMREFLGGPLATLEVGAFTSGQLFYGCSYHHATDIDAGWQSVNCN
jgi:hypothetical protein